MKVLITAGTGTVATELIKNLLQAKITPVIMGHRPEKLKMLPQGVEGVYADLRHPETWNNIFHGIDKLCLITPAMPEEGIMGEAFAKNAHENGVNHIVSLGIHKVFTAPHIPHFESKIRIKKYLEAADKPYTIIEANNFYQNDSWFLPLAKSLGFYLQPIGNIGLNRVDARDIALAISNALLSDAHHFKTYPLVGPEALTGTKTARILSHMLNREVTYPGDCQIRWEEFIKSQIPRWLLEDWKMMYEHFSANGLRADSIDFINQEKILNKAPRKYEDYIMENL